MPNTTVPAAATGLPTECRDVATVHGPQPNRVHMPTVPKIGEQTEQGQSSSGSSDLGAGKSDSDHRAIVAPRSEVLAQSGVNPRLTPVDEFLGLMDLQRRIDRRLDELVPVIDGVLGLGGERRSDAKNLAFEKPDLALRRTAPKFAKIANSLPKSGLALAGAHPGHVLYKGGRHA